MIQNLQIPQWDADGGGGALSPFTFSAADTCLFSSDHFRMFQFKVRSCPRLRSHDWTECPYVHPGEKARRRDPRKYVYSGTACPDYRKGNCMRGDTCQLAHGVFECWLHPSRYRTQLCKDGSGCRRRVCFFAHTKEELRLQVITDSSSSASPTSVLKHSFWDSPPSSTYSLVRTRGGFLSVNEDEEEPAMERVESGRDIRARIYAKLSRENSIGWVN